MIRGYFAGRVAMSVSSAYLENVEMFTKNAVKRLVGAVAVLSAVVVAPSAFAAGGPAAPDLSALTPDFSTVTTSMIAIAGAVAIVYVTWKGIKLVLRAIKGG